MKVVKKKNSPVAGNFLAFQPASLSRIVHSERATKGVERIFFWLAAETGMRAGEDRASRQRYRPRKLFRGSKQSDLGR
jgi:hypothetical protein